MARKYVRLARIYPGWLAGQTDQSKGQNENFSLNSKNLEVCGQSSNLLISDYVIIFNMLKSLAQQEISNKNRNVFRRLSSFVRQNSDYFNTYDPVNYKIYLKIVEDILQLVCIVWIEKLEQ